MMQRKADPQLLLVGILAVLLHTPSPFVEGHYHGSYYCTSIAESLGESFSGNVFLQNESGYDKATEQFGSVNIQINLTNFDDAKVSTPQPICPSSHNNLSVMPRSRVRGITLYEGTRFHEAFFGQGDSLRESFDQEKEIAEFYRDPRNSRKVSTAKVGRLIVPQYVIV